MRAQQHNSTTCEANTKVDAEPAQSACVVVEERCEAIKAAADEAVAKIMQQLKMQLLQLPKKVCALCAAAANSTSAMQAGLGLIHCPTSKQLRSCSTVCGVDACFTKPTNLHCRSAPCHARSTKQLSSRQAVRAQQGPAQQLHGLTASWKRRSSSPWQRPQRRRQHAACAAEPAQRRRGQQQQPSPGPHGLRAPARQSSLPPRRPSLILLRPQQKTTPQENQQRWRSCRPSPASTAQHSRHHQQQQQPAGHQQQTRPGVQLRRPRWMRSWLRWAWLLQAPLLGVLTGLCCARSSPGRPSSQRTVCAQRDVCSVQVLFVCQCNAAPSGAPRDRAATVLAALLLLQHTQCAAVVAVPPHTQQARRCPSTPT